MKTITAIASALVVASAIAAPAAYAQDDTPLKATVSYADLDLSRDSGRAALERRVEMAVGRVCPARPMPSELAKMHAYRECRDQAWAGAKAQLAQIYDGRAFAQASVTVAAGRK